MSEHGNCPECGGSEGNHFNDCTYDGTSGESFYSSYSRGSGSSASSGKVWAFYIIALLIGYGINELLGAIFLIGLIFWICVS